MKTIKLISLAMATALLTNVYAGDKNSATAESKVAPIAISVPNPFYLGLGVAGAFLQRDPCPCHPNGKDIKDDRYGIVARIGADYNQYIGVEARWLKTLENDVFSKTEHYGLYLKPQYPISKQSNVYALLGYGHTKVEMTNGILACDIKEDSFAYGIGIEYDLSKDRTNKTFDRAFDGQGDQEQGWGLWIDYTKVLNNASKYHLDASIVSFGITYDF
jgi:OOP family OmpA-OmpF porin